MTSLITNIVAILGALGGLGGICSVFLFYRENKRTKQLENEHKSNDEWRSLVEEHKTWSRRSGKGTRSSRRKTQRSKAFTKRKAST